MHQLFAHFSRPTRYLDVVLVMAGISIFAFYIHEDSWLIIISFTGLILSAICIGIFILSQNWIPQIIGSFSLTRRLICFCMAGVITGGALALVLRYFLFDTLFPTAVTKFVIIAPLIGISEELLFRGYIQGRIRESSRIISIVVAAAGHTIYKYIVLKTLSVPVEIELLFLVKWTLIGGLIFGILRDQANSVFPPCLAHGCFDILVYGGFDSAPVWVWQ